MSQIREPSQKVSAIVASQTHDISGGSWETEVYVDKKGKKQSEDHYVPYSGTQMSVLAQRLSSPKKPDAGISLGVIVAILFFALAGVCGLASIFTASSATTPLDASFFAGCILPTVLLGVLGGLIFVVSIVNHHQKVTQVQQIEMPRWEKTMTRWGQLYYCFRDDSVFIPSENEAVPLSQMMEYIYR